MSSRPIPRHGQALYNLGIIGLQTRRLELAAEMLSGAVVHDACNAEWLYHLALAEHYGGRFGEAVVSLPGRLSFSPAMRGAHQSRQRAH